MRGGMNMQKMMKEVQKMQKEMEASQADLQSTEFTGHDPAKMVQATVNGVKELKDITINPDAVDPDDVEMLEDLIVAAVNDANAKAEAATEKSMSKYTKNIPGF